MRISIIFLLLLLCSCYTERKASNDLDKIKGKFPSLMANKASQWYPCDSVLISIDSSGYSVAPIDSIKAIIISQIDTLELHDTICAGKCRPRIKTIRQTIYRAIEKLPSSPSVIVKTVRIKDSAQISMYEESIKLCKEEQDKYLKKSSKYSEWCMWLSLILLISILFNIIQFKK
jgi:hypothetical protein